MMKSAVAIGMLVALVAGPAAAADLAVKAPLVPVVPPVVSYGWTGFYVGGNFGYSFGYADDEWNFFAAGANAAAVSGTCRPAGSALCATGSSSNTLDGIIGGAQAGYNWQFASYLIGVETDFEASGQKGNGTLGALFPLNGTGGGTISTAYSENLTWLGTVRARAGYVIADRWFIYGTGGLAYGHVSTAGTATSIGTNIPTLAALGAGACTAAGVVGTCPVANWSDGVTKVGWTAGGGVEGALAGNWSWRVEYLHVDLGNVNMSFATLPGCYGVAAACGPVVAGTGSVSSHVTDEIVRAGIDYRFGAL